MVYLTAGAIVLLVFATWWPHRSKRLRDAVTDEVAIQSRRAKAIFVFLRWLLVAMLVVATTMAFVALIFWLGGFDGKQ